MKKQKHDKKMNKKPYEKPLLIRRQKLMTITGGGVGSPV